MKQRLLALCSVVFISLVGGTADCDAQQAKEVVLTDSPSGIRLGVPALGTPKPGAQVAKPIYPTAEDAKWNLKPIKDRLPQAPDESARFRIDNGVGTYPFEQVRGPQKLPDGNSFKTKATCGNGAISNSGTKQWNLPAINEQPIVTPDGESARLRSNFGATGTWLNQLAAPQTITATQPRTKPSEVKPLYPVPNVDFGGRTSLSTSKPPSTMLPPAKPTFEFPMNLAIPSPKKPILERLLLQGRVVKGDNKSQSHLTFGILGIQWMRLAYPTVVRVFPGTPAERAGIRPRDQIVAIDSASLLGQSIDDVTSAIIGVPGTTMIVSLEREGQLIAAVIVRMDVDDIKDSAVRAAYGRSIRRMSDPDDPADLRF
jgi:hypothetical protein